MRNATTYPMNACHPAEVATSTPAMLNPDPNISEADDSSTVTPWKLYVQLGRDRKQNISNEKTMLASLNPER